MDLGGPQLLSNILAAEELEKTPPQVQEKLSNYLNEFFDEYCKEKAAANRLHDYETKTEELQSQIQDNELKLENYDQNVKELRNQLDAVSAERTHLLEEANKYEKEMSALRLDKNTIADERDALLKVIERQNTELERLQQDVRSYQHQLKNAISAKCEAIARVDEVESKEVALEFKERRMEQERNMLQNQIQTLTEDLNRNISELQNIRRDNTMKGMHLEARLTEKIEELKISQSQCVQYKETIDRLTNNVQELSNKLLNQNEEANKMMDYYKKELEAKTKLADLYKSNCDDTVLERTELETAIADLKRMLAEASDEYGELETKFKATLLKHEQELEEKNKLIESQKAEITHANDLLKEVQHESMETAISKLAPSAAVASRLIRADMSLTELYSLYVKTSEDLELQKRENNRANLQLKTILQELNENAPMIKKQELEYEKLVEMNNILAHQRDELMIKKSDMEELMVDAHSKIGHLERENKKLKHSQTDLSRQVCYLLKEVEQLRIGLVPDSSSVATHVGNLATTDEVISKKLVTFSHIPELQENNQKLLLLVRDLSTKLEEAEALKKEFDEAAYNEKMENYVKKFQSMQETLNQQNNTVATLVSKCERYKKLYFELQKQFNKSGQAADLSDVDEDSVMNESSRVQASASATNSLQSKKSNESNPERRIRDLEQQLQEVKDQYKTLKEQYEYYAQEKKNNEKILNEQFDSMRTEVRELTSTNCKLMSSLEYTKEQIKLQQKNITTYKQQILALEDRNKNYETTIVKHEQTVHYLKDEIIKAQRGHSTAEAEANHLRHENRMLKDSAARLQSEKESLHREQQNQNLLLNNLELIKSNLERSEMEGRIRLEQRLDETVREMSAQRRRFQEEEDRFRETVQDLKRQTENAKHRMEEERLQAEKLRSELLSVRDELTVKTTQLDELSKKLQESLTPSKNDNPIVLANKKARELEVKCEEAKMEIASLSSELEKVRQHADQYYKMSQSAETEIKNLHELHTAYVAKAEGELKKFTMSEENLKSRISELEAEVQLATVTENTTPNQLPEQLKRSQEELKDSLQKLGECNRNLRTLRAENNALSESLNSVEMKYANEMVLHSADIQELSKMKTELTKVQDEIDGLRAARDNAETALANLKIAQAESVALLQKEKDELEKRIIDLNGLNATLHDQIEALTTKLSMLSQGQGAGPANASLNESSTLMETSGSGLNLSQIEDESKNSDKLLQIIKFLRKEKDLMVAKVDILKAENARLQSENAMLQKKIDELNGFLQQESAKSESSVISASKHEEIMRKIETLNAITDSNRILREERNTLADRVKELNTRISQVEDELFPLQNQNRELTTKIEELTTENSSLRTEAIKWRQRANVLVEKSNRNPEEFKRLQMERENLAKMLTSEKEHLKQATDELNTYKTEKARVDAELLAHDKQIQSLNEDKKKLGEDFTALKQTGTRMMQEIMELKNKLLQKEEAIQKLTEDIESKEAQLQDSKNKEIQIRKIAKRYKDSYLELSSKSAATGADSAPDNMELGGTNAAGDAPPANNEQLEQQRTAIESLNNVIRNLQEENEKMRKEVEDMKSAAGLEERTKSLLREAKSRIVSLTESKNAIAQELSNTKTKLQSMLQESNESHDAAINGMRTQYEETLTRKEKELSDQSTLTKEAIARLTRENESLHMRNQQLSRQLGLQQSAKPSTSSVASIDKSISESSSPRTANVKPMSGSTGVQQSATVTPWRGSETPLASIRPISVQNSRTAAILPTSQQTSGSTTSTTSTSSTSSSSSSSTATASSNTPTSAGNTALVPPQQQVHTTGSTSLESMSSSPTSSHTDYMPSTSSSALVAVAAIPPMGSASASAAESSQEAESVQQPQQNEPQQLLVSGGQQQVVALVSPRVEGSLQNAPSPQLQSPQDANQQQPSTSGTTSSTSHIAVSSHSRHTPSSSNVTTTQAGSSGGHKRPRELEGDSSTGGAEESGVGDKTSKHPKRMRVPLHGGEATAAAGLVGVTDSGLDVEYQVPTSSQRDQEDDIVVVDSDDDEEEEEEEEGMAEADDGPADPDAEHEGYEDAYEQDQDMDENERDVLHNEMNMGVFMADNNEVDLDEEIVNDDLEPNYLSVMNVHVHIVGDSEGASTSKAAAAAAAAAAASTLTRNQAADNHQQSQTISSAWTLDSQGQGPAQSPAVGDSEGASTSRAAAAATAQARDNHQQSQTISSGSYDASAGNSAQQMNWKQNVTAGTAGISTLKRQQKAATLMMQQQQGNEQDTPSGSRRVDDAAGIVSSPQVMKFSYADEDNDDKTGDIQVVDDAVVVTGEEFIPVDYTAPKKSVAVGSGAVEAGGSGAVDDKSADETKKPSDSAGALDHAEVSDEGDENFAEEAVVVAEAAENVDSESHHSSGATQSEIQDVQQNQVEATSEENEGMDGVSSEGEKPAVEELEEEGREAEATTSPTITTRSKAIKGAMANRRPNRGFQRGGRPTPIVWQGNSRNVPPNQQRGQDQQPGSPMRGFPNQRSQRARRMRRPGGNYGNMRYS